MLTALPRSSNIIAHFDAADIVGVANNGLLPSWTDRVSGIVASSQTPSERPTYIADAHNGLPAVRFNGLNRLVIGRVAALAALLAGADTWSASIIFKRPTSTSGFATMIGDAFGGSILISANASSMWGQPVSYEDDELYTASYIGWYQSAHVNGSAVSRNGQQQGNFDLCIGNVDKNYRDDNGTFGFAGDILQIIIWAGPGSPDEPLQTHKYVCDLGGMQYPWEAAKNAAMARGAIFRFPILHGDSITASDYPRQFAIQADLPYGAWTGLGHAGWAVASGSVGDKNLTDVAPFDVDRIRAVVGVPTTILWFEWYNQGFGGAGDIAEQIGYDRIYNIARKTADPTTRIVMGTSTDSWDRSGAGRDAYDSYIVNNLADLHIDYAVPLHLDPHIGVQGSAPTTYAGSNQYYVDGIHPNTPLGDTIKATLMRAGWEAFNTLPSAISISGPSSVVVGLPATFIVALDLPSNTDTAITINVGGTGAGTLSTNNPVIPAGATSIDITYTATALGAPTLVSTNAAQLLDAAITLQANSLAWAGPVAGTQFSLMGPFDITVGGTLLAGHSAALNDGGVGGTWSLADGTVVTSVALAASVADQVVQLFYTPAHPGTISLSIAVEGFPAPPPITAVIATAPPILSAFTIPDERCIVAPLAFKSAGALGLGGAVQVPQWAAALDPGDFLPFAFDLGGPFDGVAVVGVHGPTTTNEMVAAGVIFGIDEQRVMIDQRKGRVRFFVGIDEAHQRDIVFTPGRGKDVPITIVAIGADGSRVERTATLHIEQLWAAN